jgi:hypothetical protein
LYYTEGGKFHPHNLHYDPAKYDTFNVPRQPALESKKFEPTEEQNAHAKKYLKEMKERVALSLGRMRDFVLKMGYHDQTL